MSNVIPFPSKKTFSEQFKGKIPDEILENILEAYDRVVDVKDHYPSGEFRAHPEDKEKARKLARAYKEYVLTLLKKILSLEAELCLTKYELGRIRKEGS
jgi:hypothetical protein